MDLSGSKNPDVEAVHSPPDDAASPTGGENGSGALAGASGPVAPQRIVLHVGCGRKRRDKLHPLFRSAGWREVRLDIDPGVKPDIVASMADLSCLGDDSVDAVWSSHNLEHLFEHEARAALAEMVRVLKPQGFALFTTPDLMRVAREIAAGRLEDVLYTSHAGPIAAVDILFGLRRSVAAGNVHMAHRTGFDANRLGRFLVEAGFAEARVWTGDHYDLWAAGLMPGADAGRIGLPAAA